MLALLGLAAGTAIRRRNVRAGPARFAIGTLVFLFITPFCALGSAMFTIRIVHDIILAVVLAPLIVAALRLEKRDVAGSLPLWTAIHALTFWLWHAPALYEVAMSSDLAFWLMQVSITGTAICWLVKVVRATGLLAPIALFAMMVAMGILGALLTFAHRAFYAPHWFTVQDWGLTPIEDQQIAGLLMWAPGSLVYLLAALAILYRTLGTRARV